MNSFQNIIDKISEALSFFDFSFIVSGSVTYGAICYYLWRLDWLQIPNDTWIAVIASVVLIYVCGLISFILGKKLRIWHLKKSMTEGYKNKFLAFFSMGKDKEIFKYNYNRIVTDLLGNNERAQILKGIKYGDVELSEEQAQLEYTVMWSYLRDCKECERTVTFINRFWVMQAVCEGLLFSSIVIIIGGILAIVYSLYNFGWGTDMFIQYISCIIAGCIGVFAFYKEGRRYAESQIQEVVITYYRIVQNFNNQIEK